MTNGIRFLALLGAISAFFIQAPSAHAQASRTWVSGVGDDANPCSRTAPCKTFAGAISKTASGGEIDVLDPGGFGALTITKPITLDGGGGLVASILVAGTNGINISAGSGAVILRNLRIAGVGSGLNGINYVSASSLLVENCEIFGFTLNGINIAPSAGTNSVVIQRTTANNNSQGGIQVKPTGGTTNITVTGSYANNNAFGIGIDTTGGGTASMIVDHTTANENGGNGAQAGGAASTLLFSNSSFSYNATGVTITSPAVGNTFQNNIIAQNSVANTNPATLLTNSLK
jgi:hypothetical protein